jgi:hypothetical protein
MYMCLKYSSNRHDSGKMTKGACVVTSDFLELRSLAGLLTFGLEFTASQLKRAS